MANQAATSVGMVAMAKVDHGHRRVRRRVLRVVDHQAHCFHRKKMAKTMKINPISSFHKHSGGLYHGGYYVFDELAAGPDRLTLPHSTMVTEPSGR